MTHIDPKSSFFITANHTGAGKTLVSYLICRRYGQTYFKPVESGTPGDSAIIKSSGGDINVVPALYSFAQEKPPHYLAEQAGEKISLSYITSHLPPKPFILESAGGWFSPLNNRETMADLASACQLPIIAVFRAYLGSINHAVLTLEAILNSKLPLAGYVINGDDLYGMRRFLQDRFPAVYCLACLPDLGSASAESLLSSFSLADT